MQGPKEVIGVWVSLKLGIQVVLGDLAWEHGCWDLNADPHNHSTYSSQRSSGTRSFHPSPVSTTLLGKGCKDPGQPSALAACKFLAESEGANTTDCRLPSSVLCLLILLSSLSFPSPFSLFFPSLLFLPSLPPSSLSSLI